MGFTKALYYPTIDIKNEDWLKTAILFWDEINTIVPESIKNPYEENSTQYLFDEGVLKPIIVRPDFDFIEDLTTDVINHINSSEGFQLLTQGHGNSFIHREKMPRDVQRLFEIYEEKLPYFLQHQLQNYFASNNGWIKLDSNFAAFYMTLLANKICEQNSLALLTADTLISNFTDKVRLDTHIAISQRDFNHRRRESRFHDQERIYLAQGLLTNLIIEGIKISNTSTLTDILKFKANHKDELGLFRTNIAKLTQNV